MDNSERFLVYVNGDSCLTHSRTDAIRTAEDMFEPGTRPTIPQRQDIRDFLESECDNVILAMPNWRIVRIVHVGRERLSING